MNELLVERGGVCATVQDLGRRGYQGLGVAVGGAIDRGAALAANLLVGNPGSAPLLEIALHGTAVQFTQPTLIAVCGGDLRASVNGMSVPLDRPVRIQPHRMLQFLGARQGNFAFLAVAGSLDVPWVLGGWGTHLQSRFGGWQGRALQAGDRIPVGPASARGRAVAEAVEKIATGAAVDTVGWGFAAPQASRDPQRLTIRILPGCHFAELTSASQRELFGARFRVTPECNRMGFRLDGTALHFRAELELPSMPTVAGTIQLPHRGSPIVLMADAAPTGGYPHIGYVISADLPRVAQAEIGQWLEFVPVTPEEARQAAARAARDLRLLSRAIGWHLGQANGVVA